MELREPSARYMRATHQTDVGELPADWSCSSLGDVADILTGFPFSSAGYSGTGVRLLRGSNVKRDQIEWREDLTMYWPEVTGEIRKYVLKVGDVVIAMDGSLVGRSFGALSESDVPALLLQRVARVRSSEVNVGYLKHWICSERFTAHSDAVKTTTAIPHISPGDIRSFKVAVPPTIAEQQQIGQALSDADALIGSLEQLLTKKRQTKQGAMQELLTGKRRLPGFKEKWDETTFADVAFIDSENLGSGTRADFSFNYIALEGVDQGRLISFAEIQFNGAPSRARRVLREGDVLVATVRPNLKSHLLLDTLQGNWIGSTGFSVVRCKPDRACPGFLFALLFSSVIERQIDALLTGSNYPAINGRDVANLAFACPSVNEQEAISQCISDMSAEIAALESRLTKARALKKAMAQSLLTGRIRLVEPI